MFKQLWFLFLRYTLLVLSVYATQSAYGAAGDSPLIEVLKNPVDFTPVPDCHFGFTLRDAFGFRCYTFESVLDRHQNDLNAPKTRLFFAIRPADDPEHSKGLLLFNFGGPGIDTAQSLMLMAKMIPVEILQHFDLVGLDPRGTGYSEFADQLAQCSKIKEQDSEQQSEQAACDWNQLPFMRYLGTQALVHDLHDLTTRLVGEHQRISFIGYSYGTRVGALYAQLYPDNVRALVLDSPMSPINHATETMQQVILQDTKNNLMAVVDKICQQHVYPTLCHFYTDLEAIEAHPAQYQRYAIGLSHEPLVISDFLYFALSHSYEFESVADTGERLVHNSMLLDSNVDEDELMRDAVEMAHSLLSLRDPDLNDLALIRQEVLRAFPYMLNFDDAFLRQMMASFNQQAAALQYQLNHIMGIGKAVLCSDRTPAEIDVDEQAYVHDEPTNLFKFREWHWHLCQGWRHPADPVGHVQGSRMPALIIGNEYDPSTPKFWYEEMKQAFPSGYYLWVKDSFNHGYAYHGFDRTLNQPKPETTASRVFDTYVTDYLLHVDAAQFEHDDLKQGQEVVFAHQFPAKFKLNVSEFYLHLGAIWERLLVRAQADE